MDLKFEQWCKDLLALQKKFNTTRDPIQRFAILTALKSDFEKHVKWMNEELENFKKRAVDMILGHEI